MRGTLPVIVKNMKSTIWIFTVLALPFSCSDRNQELKSELIVDSNDSIPETQEIKFQDVHPTFKKWQEYYVTLDSNFVNNEFILSTTVKSEFIEGNIFGTFDKEFDKTYLPFLVYNTNKEQYIDFNSYHWTLVEGEPQFEVDQEINLVNIKEETIQRISFCGSQELVEDAYWMNDSTVVLLENVNGNTPQINVVDLYTQSLKIYKSQYASKLNSEYFRKRIISGLQE